MILSVVSILAGWGIAQIIIGVVEFIKKYWGWFLLGIIGSIWIIIKIVNT